MTTVQTSMREWAKPSSVAIAALLCVSAGIHALVIPEHLREWWLAGVFFGVAAIGQTFGALQVVRGISRRWAAAGAIGNLALVGVWILSRTAGLPFGPEAHVVEPIGALDLISTACEVLAAVGYAGLWGRGATSHLLRSRPLSRVAAVSAVVLASVLAGAGASALPQHEHGHEPTAPFVDGNGSIVTLPAGHHHDAGTHPHTHP